MAHYIRGRYDKVKLPKDYTTIEGESQTIPGETYSIRELLIKHTQGILPPGIDREPIYSENQNFDSPDLQKIDRLDIVEKKEIQQQQTDIISQINEQTKKQHERKKNEKAVEDAKKEDVKGGKSTTSSNHDNAAEQSSHDSNLGNPPTIDT